MGGLRTFSIAISGKGGTGKTTLSALLVRALVDAGRTPVLAVDADPNSNLHEALGVRLHETLGCMRESDFRRNIPPGMARNDYIELCFRRALVEEKGFDLVAMGRPEGSGCYCFANDLLKTCMTLLRRDYRFIVIDNEAGMEHLSRGTMGIPDIIIIVSDPGTRGMKTAVRIRDLAWSLGLSDIPVLLVVNRFKGTSAAGGAPEPDGFIPEDPEIETAEIAGKPVGCLSKDSKARAAAVRLAEKLIAMANEKNRY
jgi:CO dehydrogenase maturation factor